MKNFRSSIVGAAIVSMVALAGCGADQKSSTPAPQTTQAPTSATNVGTGFVALNSVVSKAKTAVNAGNFSQATQDFNQFEDAWKSVEDDVKAKSPSGYGAIEDAATQVSSALKSNNKVKAMTGLQTLETTIATVSRS
ncbi:MAG: DUF4363 domain-containing protein [Phormidesmis sp. CAN_BIN44]|nr:DUF4363 domain-containing protein [Phormidesmis sp. CAN_BIN44]